MFFKGTTFKQWGLDPEELAPEVTARIPVRYNRDDRYFEDPYQGVPKLGYTVMVAKMIDHPKIHLLLNCDYKEVVNEIKYGAMINTGPIDYHFDYKFGPLPLPFPSGLSMNFHNGLLSKSRDRKLSE